MIHPSITERLPRAARIADVAAGSGPWTLGVAKLLPEAQIDAYDISADQFPKNHPATTTFSVHNAKEAFPDHLHRTYDLVHVRALVAALEPAEWKIVLNNLRALLKPDGILQWTEADLQRTICLRGEEQAKFCHAIPQLLKLFHEAAKNRVTYGVHELPGLLEESGYKDVQTDWIGSDRVHSTRSTLTSTYMVALLGWAKQSGTLDDEELVRLRQQINDEIAAGAYIRGDILVVIGSVEASH